MNRARTKHKDGAIVSPDGRVTTGLGALDGILRGGFPKKSLILVAGNPGSGKTTLCRHFLAEGIGRGESCVYVSLGESREQFLEDSRSSGFDFDSDLFHFFSFLTTSKKHSGGSFEDFVNLVVESKAKRLVIDSISAMIETMGDQSEVRNAMHLIFEMIAKKMGVATIIVGEIPMGRRRLTFDFKEFLADGVVLVLVKYDERTGRYTRSLRVEKMRATPLDDCTLNFSLGDHGIRTHTKVSAFFPDKAYRSRISIGVPALDEMMGGGLFKGSITLVKGATGTGKSNFSTQFLNEGLTRKEKCMFLTNEDSVAELKKGASLIGLSQFTKHTDRLRMETIDTETMGISELTDKLNAMIKEFRPQRLVFDGLSGLSTLLTSREIRYLISTLRALSNSNGMTTLVTSTDPVVGATNSDEVVFPLFDGILALRNSERDGTMVKSMVLLKLRSQHDVKVHEFEIRPGRGIVIKA
jgi:circadian clock protein KaiC